VRDLTLGTLLALQAQLKASAVNAPKPMVIVLWTRIVPPQHEALQFETDAERYVVVRKADLARLVEGYAYIKVKAGAPFPASSIADIPIIDLDAREEEDAPAFDPVGHEWEALTRFIAAAVASGAG
jgi:hypothetical protein